MSDVITEAMREAPELIAKAGAMAEAESEAADGVTTARICQPEQVGGRPAVPFSFSRRHVCGMFANQCEKIKGREPDELESALVAVFVLFGGCGLHKLSQLAKDPDAMIAAAEAFDEESDQADYQTWVNYCQEKLAHYGQVADGGGQGGEPEKNG